MAARWRIEVKLRFSAFLSPTLLKPVSLSWLDEMTARSSSSPAPTNDELALNGRDDKDCDGWGLGEEVQDRVDMIPALNPDPE